MNFKEFDPLKTSIDKIPSCEGNYIVVLRDESNLPKDKIDIELKFSLYNNHRVIYTGISKDLRKRDIGNHLNGTGGSSTLRKSLGVLFGYQLYPRDKNNPKSKKTTFKIDDEEKLSTWMKNNLLFYHWANNESDNNEKVLINTYDPPLNLDKSQVSEDSENKAYRDAVSALRSSKNMVKK